MLGTFAVPGHLPSQFDAQCTQRFHKQSISLTLFGDLHIAGHTVGHQHAGIIGGGIAVHADAIEADTHSLLERRADQIFGNRTVCDQKAQHGTHIGVDHTAALGNTADCHGFAADFHRHGFFLFHGIRGHNSLGRRVGTGAAQLFRAARQRLFDGGNVDGLADDASGTDHHILRRNSQLFSCRPGHPFRVFTALFAASVGVAAVGHHSLSRAVLQRLARPQH